MIVRITKGSKYSVSIITDDVLRTYEYIDHVEMNSEYGTFDSVVREVLSLTNEEYSVYVEALAVLVCEDTQGKRIVKVFLT